jgi:hypothetical protein
LAAEDGLIDVANDRITALARTYETERCLLSVERQADPARRRRDASPFGQEANQSIEDGMALVTILARKR